MQSIAHFLIDENVENGYKRVCGIGPGLQYAVMWEVAAALYAPS